MESKYYTPTIEEFHVGFEYEYYEQCLFDLPDKKTPIWINKVFGNEYEELDSVAYDIAQTPSTIRIKYLDKEDIESLGWEFIKVPYRNNIIRKLKKEYLDRDISKLKTWELDECYYYMDYNFDTNNLVIHNGAEYSSSYVWFDGIIKNKSELKGLLKQLGIE